MRAGRGEPDAGIVTRDATPGDRDAIREVTLAAYGQYASRLPSPLWSAYRENILATLADPRPAEQIVAEDAGAVIGAVLLYPARPAGHAGIGSAAAMPWPEVRLLAVAPAGRRRGVGAALMAACVSRARRAGAGKLALHTTEMMEGALRIYRRMGFVRAPELDFSPAPTFTVHGYVLDLRVT